MRLVSLALIFVLLATASALAQDPSAKPATIAATVNKTWSGLERDFISATEAGVFIDNACRPGTCGWCRVKLISGTVSMAVEDALTVQDKAEGYILTCQAKIRGDVKVDA